MEELKPCPFCGNKAELLYRSNDIPYSIVCTSKLYEDCFLYSGYEERQENDARSWDDVLSWYNDREEAIKAWNTRYKDNS